MIIITPEQIWTAMLTSWSEVTCEPQLCLWPKMTWNNRTHLPRWVSPGSLRPRTKAKFHVPKHDKVNSPRSIHQGTCDLVPEDMHRTNPKVIHKPPGKCDPFFWPKHTTIFSILQIMLSHTRICCYQNCVRIIQAIFWTTFSKTSICNWCKVTLGKSSTCWAKLKSLVWTRQWKLPSTNLAACRK